MKPRPQLLLAGCTLLLTIVAVGLLSPLVDGVFPASAVEQIPPGLTPVSYLP